MFGLFNRSRRPLHPQVPELVEDFARGEIGRRDLLKTLSCLGVSVAGARLALGLGPDPAQAQAETPKKGGTLRFACQIMEMKDPTATTWFQAANVFRNSLQYLTLVDEDNIAQPYLAESWDPSADLKTWRFKLRQDVTWSNGDKFTTEDVAYTFKRWLAPESKSVNKTTFKSITDLEVVGPHEFVLHLDRPILSIPEMLYAPACPMLHRSFDATGADWSKNPIGTGPYQLTDFAVGQRATLKKRPGYWGKEPLLDELRYIDLGGDSSTTLAALVGNQVDILYRINAADLELAGRMPTVKVLTAPAAQTCAMRMQVNQAPFDDIRVRKALVYAADNQAMLDVAIRGAGQVAGNYHVAPFHPEYAPLAPLKRDVARAKQLMAEAGHANGLDVTMMIGNTQGIWEQNTAQILQQNAAEAGIRIKLNVVPTAQFWPVWDKVQFGLTYWAHRPLAVQTLDLAYRGGAAWNESRFNDKSFDAALDRAMAIVNPKERAKVMLEVETILQDAAVMVQPFWLNKYTAVSNRVRGYRLHPSDAFNVFGTWLA